MKQQSKGGGTMQDKAWTAVRNFLKNYWSSVTAPVDDAFLARWQSWDEEQ